MILKMGSPQSKPVVESASGTDSLHSNRAVFIYWGNFLGIHHLPINSIAMVGIYVRFVSPVYTMVTLSHGLPILKPILTFIVDINDCENITCSGVGTCIDFVAHFECFCDAGYTGILCETGESYQFHYNFYITNKITKSLEKIRG